jgi:hypothetical protein
VKLVHQQETIVNMIDLFDLYNSFKSYVNTYQGGFYRPQTDFTSACNDISMKLWVKWTNMAEKSFEIKDNLAPFFVSKNMIVKKEGASYGYFSVPKNYGRFAAARIIVAGNKTYPAMDVDDGKCDNGDFEDQQETTEAYYDSITENPVDMVDSQRWAAMHKHVNKRPTFEKPKIRQVDKQIQVSPRQVSVIVLDYYVFPKPATFLYTVVPGNVQTGAGDLIQYNQQQSTPLEWPASLRDEFLIQLGERYGLFTRDAFVSQVAAQQKAVV